MLIVRNEFHNSWKAGTDPLAMGNVILVVFFFNIRVPILFTSF